MTIRFSPPVGLTTNYFPVYSGFISIRSSTSENLQIGYMGLAASMMQINCLDDYKYSTRLNYYSNSYYGSVYENQIINFQNGYMVLETALFLGTAVLRIDIAGSYANKTEGGMLIVDSIIDYPQFYIPRSGSEALKVEWSGLLRSGRQIRPGTYFLLLRALKIFGNRNKASDYYTLSSPKFIVT